MSESSLPIVIGLGILGGAVAWLAFRKSEDEGAPVLGEGTYKPLPAGYGQALRESRPIMPGTPQSLIENLMKAAATREAAAPSEAPSPWFFGAQLPPILSFDPFGNILGQSGEVYNAAPRPAEFYTKQADGSLRTTSIGKNTTVAALNQFVSVPTMTAKIDDAVLDYWHAKSLRPQPPSAYDTYRNAIANDLAVLMWKNDIDSIRTGQPPEGEFVRLFVMLPSYVPTWLKKTLVNLDGSQMSYADAQVVVG